MSEPPKCPVCGEPLLGVDEATYRTYRWDPKVGTYLVEDPWDGDVKVSCACEADLRDVFPNGVSNYWGKKKR